MITLFDQNVELCAAWRKAFADTDIEIVNCTLNELEPQEALVTAGNSQGIMTGGIDYAVKETVLTQNEYDNIQDYILCELPYGIPVGEYLDMKISSERFKRLIYAPTMRKPSRISAFTVSYVASVVFSVTADTIAIPGLGTKTGGLPLEVAAKAMRAGYDTTMKLRAL